MFDRWGDLDGSCVFGGEGIFGGVEIFGGGCGSLDFHMNGANLQGERLGAFCDVGEVDVFAEVETSDAIAAASTEGFDDEVLFVRGEGLFELALEGGHEWDLHGIGPSGFASAIFCECGEKVCIVLSGFVHAVNRAQEVGAFGLGLFFGGLAVGLDHGAGIGFFVGADQQDADLFGPMERVDGWWVFLVCGLCGDQSAKSTGCDIQSAALSVLGESMGASSERKKGGVIEGKAHCKGECVCKASGKRGAASDAPTVGGHLGSCCEVDRCGKLWDADAMGFFAHDGTDGFCEWVVTRPRFGGLCVECEVHPWFDGDGERGISVEDGVCT